MTEYKKIHIWDLPKEKFSVKINQKYLKLLFQKNIDRFGNLTNLTEYLHKNCSSLNNFTFESAYYRIEQCKENKYQLPLDCFIELINICKEDIKNAEKNIELLGCKYVKNPLNIKFPIIFDENFAIVSEAIRTEGSLSKDLRKLEIGNSDTKLLSIFKKALFDKFKLTENNIKFSLDSQIAIPNNIKKNEITICDLTNDRKIDNFALIDKTVAHKIKRQIFITDYNVTWPDKKEYLIKFRDKQIKCKIEIPEKGAINYKSDFNGYENNISSVLKLKIGNIIIGKMLNHILKIQGGRKSRIIFLPDIVKYSPKIVIKKAFEITFACEGSASKNEVRVRSISKEFLMDWKNLLLDKFNIESNITNKDTQLQITRKNNFKKLLKEFNFIQHKKYEQIVKNSQVMDMLPPHTADKFYLDAIKALGGRGTNREIAKISEKSFVAVKSHLPMLIRKGLIEKQIIERNGKCIYKIR